MLDPTALVQRTIQEVMMNANQQNPEQGPIPFSEAKSTPVPPVANVRRHARYKLPAMYTLVRMRYAGDKRYRWTGYIYDVSLSGLRFEMDDAIMPGSDVEIRAMLPGLDHVTFKATGHVVRIHDDCDEPGPVRMGLQFDSFPSEGDRDLLLGYLSSQSERLVA